MSEKKKAVKVLTEAALDAATKSLPVAEEAINKAVKYLKEAAERKIEKMKSRIEEKTGEKNESPK